MLAYVEALMSEYSMTHHEAIHEFPLCAGLHLMEARQERVAPGMAVSWVDTVAMRATDEEKARIARDYTIID